jgi:hypothetical protein
MHLFYIYKRVRRTLITAFPAGAAVFTLSNFFCRLLRHCGALLVRHLLLINGAPLLITVHIASVISRAFGALACFLHFNSIFIKRNAGDDNDKNDASERALLR